MNDASLGTQTRVFGAIDHIDGPAGRVEGWCWSPDEATTHRKIGLFVDGVPIATILCDHPRPDLETGGIGDGSHAFSYDFQPEDGALAAGMRVEIQDIATGASVVCEIVQSPPEAEISVDAPIAIAPDPALPVAGYLDAVTDDGQVSGWCWYPQAPERHVEVSFVVENAPVGSVVARLYRQDLHQAGIGHGHYGFVFFLPWSVIEGRRVARICAVDAATGAAIGDPFVLKRRGIELLDERIRDMENTIRLLRTRIDELDPAGGQRPASETAALFQTIGTFFSQIAANATPSAAIALTTGLRGVVEDIAARLPVVTLAVPLEVVATIFVSAQHSLETIHACLSALHDTGADRHAEIVLLDDGDIEEAALLPTVVRNVVYTRQRADKTTVEARNAAAGRARGAVLVFLAAGVLVAPGWLEALLETLGREPSAGLVGSRVTRDDGLVHHAGVMLLADGQIAQFGRGEDVRASAYRFLRPVDAMGDFGFAVRAADFAAMGGFDTAFHAKFANMGATHVGAACVFDLCARLREAGRAVLLQPAAEARLATRPSESDHLSLHDLGLPDDNSQILRHRWVTSSQLPPAAFIGHALVIDNFVPRPDRDAGSSATFEQMKLLRGLGYHVTFAATLEPTIESHYVTILQSQGIEVIEPRFYPSVTAYLEQEGGALDLVQLYRFSNMEMLSARIRALAPRAQIVFSPADLHFLREARGAVISGRPIDETRIAAVKKAELGGILQGDATIITSDFELALVRRELGDAARVHLLRWIAETQPTTRGFADRSGLCFVGSFRHPPNASGIIWFVEEVLPLILATAPDVHLHIAGSDPPPEVLALAGPAVTVHGWVEDLTAMFNNVRLSVAPLLFGAGFKGKVGSSLAHGVPVVATSIANEGTGVAPGDAILVADEPAAFAAHVVRLHEDAAAWQAASIRAIDACETLYSPEAARETYASLLNELGLPARG